MFGKFIKFSFLYGNINVHATKLLQYKGIAQVKILLLLKYLSNTHVHHRPSYTNRLLCAGVFTCCCNITVYSRCVYTTSNSDNISLSNVCMWKSKTRESRTFHIQNFLICELPLLLLHLFFIYIQTETYTYHVFDSSLFWMEERIFGVQ